MPGIPTIVVLFPGLPYCCVGIYAMPMHFPFGTYKSSAGIGYAGTFVLLALPVVMRTYGILILFCT